jgi:hypothetical protein
VSDKISNASIDEESSIIDEGGDSSGSGAPTGMVLDPDGESILNSEKGRLKADGVQEGFEGVSLFAPSSHVAPWQKRGGGATVGVLEPVEKLGGELSKTRANEAPWECVETVLVV